MPPRPYNQVADVSLTTGIVAFIRSFREHYVIDKLTSWQKHSPPVSGHGLSVESKSAEGGGAGTASQSETADPRSWVSRPRAHYHTTNPAVVCNFSSRSCSLSRLAAPRNYRSGLKQNEWMTSGAKE